MKKYKVISFDIFQTLVDVNQRIPEIWKELLKEDYTVEDGKRGGMSIVKQIGPLYQAACEKFVTMEEFYVICGEKAAQELGLEMSGEVIAECLMRQHGLAPYYEHVLDVVERLKEKYTVILSSDASHLMADPIIERVQPDYAFLSDNLKCYKGAAEGRFFQKILEELNISPEEMIHIGDGVGDMKGAACCGIDCCLVKRQNVLWEEDIQSDYVIHDFLELKNIL